MNRGFFIAILPSVEDRSRVSSSSSKWSSFVGAGPLGGETHLLPIAGDRVESSAGVRDRCAKSFMVPSAQRDLIFGTNQLKATSNCAHLEPDGHCRETRKRRSGVTSGIGWLPNSDLRSIITWDATGRVPRKRVEESFHGFRALPPTPSELQAISRG